MEISLSCAAFFWWAGLDALNFHNNYLPLGAASSFEENNLRLLSSHFVAARTRPGSRPKRHNKTTYANA